MADERAKVAGIDELLWPLTQVSPDPTNLTKLDTDGNVLTSTVDVDARYVKKAGDTMTGQLIVAPAVGINSPDGSISLRGEETQTNIAIQRAGNTNANPALRLTRTRGTLAAQTPVQNGDGLGGVFWFSVNASGASAAAGQMNVQCSANALAGDTTVRTRWNLSLGNGTALPTVMTVTPDSFIVSTTSFSVGASGAVTSKDGVLVQRSRGGDTVRIEQTGTGSGETSLALYAMSAGASPTTGGITGVRGEVTGTYSVGIGVAGFATGTATTNYGLQAFASGGTVRNVGLYIGADIVEGTGSYAVESQSAANVFFKGRMGLNFGSPTHQLEVGGDSMLRGPLEVVGNITSSGTAHSFASNSIPSTAVIGNIPRTIAATGSAGSSGQMVWDDNFIYLRTTSGWKKVALTAI